VASAAERTAPSVCPAARRNGQRARRKPKKHAKPEAECTACLTDADAVRVLDELRQALEIQQSQPFLKAVRCPQDAGYGAFRDPIAEFLESYDAFQLGYHVTQVTVDGRVRR